MPKYKLQEMSSLNGVGKNRVFPKIVTNRQLDTKEFVKNLHSYNHTISESIIEAVLTDMGDCLVRLLSQGYTVKLDDIGTFSLSLEFDDKKPVEMTDNDDKMLYRNVTVKDVNYKSSPQLIKHLKSQTVLERDMGGVSRLYKNKYTPKERIKRATNWIDKHGIITLQEYATLNNLSRTSASGELKKLSEGDEAPFESKGKGSHKVWVKAGWLGNKA